MTTGRMEKLEVDEAEAILPVRSGFNREAAVVRGLRFDCILAIFDRSQIILGVNWIRRG